jgi:hypothetical protein
MEEDVSFTNLSAADGIGIDKFGNQDQVDLWERERTRNTRILSQTAGDGTSANPHLLTNITEVQSMKADLDGHYELANDIDAAETAQWNEVDGTYRGFLPIGDRDSPFTGVIDGRGHAITNLHVDQSENQRRVGVFGVADGAVISNLQLDDVRMTGGRSYAGVLGGSFISATVTDVSVSGSLTHRSPAGGVVADARSGTYTNISTDVVMSGSEVGGIIGYADEDVVLTESVSAGSISATGAAGGLIAKIWEDGAVLDSSSSVNIDGESGAIGGLVGLNIGEVRNATSSGRIEGDGRVGGLVGTLRYRQDVGDGEFQSGLIADSRSSSEVVGE